MLPRPIRKLEPVIAQLAKAEWFHLCLCLAAQESERDAYREFSIRNGIDILTVVKSEPWSPEQAALTISADLERQARSYAAVLLFDGPGCLGFEREQRRAWNERFAREASAQVRDIQILEYASSWAFSPPRIR